MQYRGLNSMFLRQIERGSDRIKFTKENSIRNAEAIDRQSDCNMIWNSLM